MSDDIEPVAAPPPNRKSRGHSRRVEARARAAPDTRENVSRESDTRENDIQFSRDDIFEAVNPLAAPPPRTGMVQRWIRTLKTSGERDMKNLNSQTRKGWRSRKWETVDKSYIESVMGQDFAADGNIEIEGMVLMERPVEIHQRYQDYVNAERQRQALSVEQTLFNEYTPNRGIGRPRTNVTQRVVMGNANRAPRSSRQVMPPPRASSEMTDQEFFDDES